MRVERTEDGDDMLGALTAGFALLISIFATAALAYVDTSSAIQLSKGRQLATEFPQSGTLRGHDAIDQKEWVPGKDGKVVLFDIAESGQGGDVGFWRDVASRTREKIPDVMFVGFCGAGKSCSLPAGPVNELTILAAMDPVQLRTIATAAHRNLALLYRGSTLKGRPAMLEDRQAFAAEIAVIFNQGDVPPIKAGGT